MGASFIAPLNLSSLANNYNSKEVDIEKDYNYDGNYSYILGAGDVINIEMVGVKEYSGTFSVTPDGTITFPNVREVNVEGKTINELKEILKTKYRQKSHAISAFLEFPFTGNTSSLPPPTKFLDILQQIFFKAP